jgi:prophage antirepressor-like protein
MTTSNITRFQCNAHQLRVVTIDGNPWFVAKDVCALIGIKEFRSTVHLQMQRLAEGQKAKHLLPAMSGDKQARVVFVISESGLLKLISCSIKPQARAFQEWVTSDVLPAIRKCGGCVMGQEKSATGEMSAQEFMARAVLMAQDVIAKGKEVINSQAEEITALKKANQVMAKKLAMMTSILGVQGDSLPTS